MRLQSTSKRKAKTSHMPNPTRVGKRTTPFKVNGYMTSGGKGGKKKGGSRHRSAKRMSK